jgi:hypothetical protein
MARMILLLSKRTASPVRFITMRAVEGIGLRVSSFGVRVGAE